MQTEWKTRKNMMMKLEDNREICASCRSKPSSYRYKGYCQRQVRAAQTITTTVGVWSQKLVTPTPALRKSGQFRIKCEQSVAMLAQGSRGDALCAARGWRGGWLVGLTAAPHRGSDSRLLGTRGAPSRRAAAAPCREWP